MIKKGICLALFILICFSFTSCWDYRSITVLDIVSGLAIDKDEETGLYRVTLEIATASTEGKGAAESVYVDAEGTTIFNAIYNTKKKLANKFFLGNMQVVIISKYLAENEGITPLINALLRDKEPRETLNVVVSQEKTAKDLLCVEGIDLNVVSQEILKIIEDDIKTTFSTQNTKLYQIYNAVKGQGYSLVLPAFKAAPAVKSKEDEEEKNVESNGVALFKKDHLVGFLTADQTKTMLIITDQLKGGTFNFGMREDKEDDVSMEFKNVSSVSNFKYQNGEMEITLSVKADVNLSELKMEEDSLAENPGHLLEKKAAETLKNEIEALVEIAQSEMKIDIFSFGNKFYKNYPDEWKKIKDDWHEVFCKAKIEVKTSFTLLNAGIIE